jgi:hypothetical protein
MARPPAVVHAAVTAVDVPLRLGRSERLAPTEAAGQRGQRVERRLHRRGRRAGGHDVDLASRARHARVFGMHGGDGGHVTALRHPAGERARQAVAPGAEGRPGDEQVRLPPIELRGDGARRLLCLLAGEVVAADDRGLDERARAQRDLQEAAGADGAGLHRHPDRGLVLAADAAEELVQVVHDA